jgi:predicted metal-dependent hydrolase
MLGRLKTILSNSLSDPEVVIEGESVPVRIRRNPRAKRISMRADAVKREIRITMPHYTPTNVALDFVEKKWLDIAP